MKRKGCQHDALLRLARNQPYAVAFVYCTNCQAYLWDACKTCGNLHEPAFCPAALARQINKQLNLAVAKDAILSIKQGDKFYMSPLWMKEYFRIMGEDKWMDTP